MPPKNIKFQKPKSALFAPAKAPHQPPHYESLPEAPRMAEAKPKAVEFKPAKTVQPVSFSSTKLLNSMWFHMALIAVAVLGFTILFLKTHVGAKQIQADIGRLNVDLKTIQLQVKNTNNKVVKLQDAVTELSSSIALPTTTAAEPTGD